MSTIKEFIISLFESSKERLKNPIIGAFLISWAAVNWRIVLTILLSNKSIEDRIEIINTQYSDFLYVVWLPLIFALFYLLVLPYVMSLFDWLSVWAITYRKKISHGHRMKDLENRLEIATEERQLELIKQGSPDVSKLKDEIEQLEKEKEDLLYKLSGHEKSRKSTDSNESEESEDRVEKDEENEPSGKDDSNDSKSTKKKTTTKKPQKTEASVLQDYKLPSSKNYPSMRDNVIRNIAKSEKEWILIYSFYASDFGKKEFTRDHLLAAYDETKRKTNSRHANLSNNLNALVKQSLIRYLNDNEMLLTDEGISLSEEILNR